jgi:hypothetical protein
MTKLNFNPQRRLAVTLLSAVTLAVGCAKTNFVEDPLQTGSSATGITKTISSTQVVEPANKQVDFLLVLDDSNSMLPELKKLSSRMAIFVTFLEASQIDWQMCVTTTRNAMHGNYLAWNRYSPIGGTPNFVLTKGTPNLGPIFTSTIDTITIGSADSGDERAIKSAFVSFKNGGPCYRPGAAVSVIAISDEDERSVGGDAKNLKRNDAVGSLLPLEAEDLPVNLLAQAQSSFGSTVRFTFNSIIVKPGDKKCEGAQDTDLSPSHPGFHYEEIAKMTDGGVGSICDADYSSNLNTFKNKIINSLGQLPLQCEPVKGSLKVWINHKLVSNFRSEKNILRFAEALGEGTRIDLIYDCKE